MFLSRPIILAAAAVLGCGMPAWCVGQQAADPTILIDRIAELEEQAITLQQSLVEARRREQESAETLASIRTRLEALGHNLFDAGDKSRLVHAAADVEVLTERVQALEAAATSLAASIGDYLRQAVVADPDARMRVETSLRELDAVVGLRDKPRPDVRVGSLQGARVVSIDSRSGMLVLNVGDRAGARIGMSFRLVRGERPFGRAIVADIRDDVCGAFVEGFDAPEEEVRIGDQAILETTR